jgi:tetratricopeptide (TPR) repeat protein
MDIWAWVEDRYDELYDNGNARLADLLYDIPSLVCDDEAEAADQKINEALALAQSIDDKWVEVFLRHWRLQSKILKNYDVRGMLPEAVALLDFAHTEETKGCPQRICAVQDLAAGYGIKDGIGYVEERVSVARETLAEINGSWPCYKCIGSELLDALLDGGRYKEALYELSKMDREMAVSEDADASEITFSRCRAYLGLDDLDKAWALIEKAYNACGGESYKRHQKLLKTLVLCRQEKWDDAFNECPSFEDAMLAATYYDDWTHCKYLMVCARKETNTEELRRQFHQMVTDLIKKDANRKAIIILERLIKLCVAANAKLRAQLSLEAIEGLLPRLHKDLGATETHQRLCQQVEAMDDTAANDFDSVDALLEHQFEDEDSAYQSYLAAKGKWPTSADVVVGLSQILVRHFDSDKAFGILQSAYESLPSDAVLEHSYGEAYIAKHGFQEYQKNFPMDDLGTLVENAVWNRGFLHVRYLEGHDPAQVLTILRQIQKYWADDLYLLGEVARILIKLGEYEAALKEHQRRVSLDPDDANHKWDLLISASLTGEAEIVCDTASELDMSVNAEGYFDTDKRPNIRLRMSLPDGGDEICFAVRNGPVTARITSISRIEDGYQFYDHEVVFDPLPLNVLDQKDDEGYPCDSEGNYTLLYPHVGTRETPKYDVFPIDGFHPGDDLIADLREKIEAAGFVFSRRSSDDYQLRWGYDSDDPKQASAIYIYILMSQEHKKELLSDLLKEFAQGLKKPLVWLELAEAIGDDALVITQREICQKYNI